MVGRTATAPIKKPHYTNIILRTVVIEEFMPHRAFYCRIKCFACLLVGALKSGVS